MLTYRELNKKQKWCVRSILRGVVPKGLDVRSYLYSEVFPEDVEAEEDYIKRRAETWVKSQRGYGHYGKYAALAGKIMDSGMVFSPSIHRSYLTRSILECDGKVYVGTSAYQIARNTLRILKCKSSSEKDYAYMVNCICKHTDKVVQLAASSQTTGCNTAKELFNKLSGISNWHCISLQHPGRAFKDAFPSPSWKIWRTEAAKLLLQDIENFGYASACLYLADLGSGYKWCQPYVDKLRELRYMLLSREDSKIQEALVSATELMSVIAAARKGTGEDRRIPHQESAENVRTSVFS